MDDSTLTSAPVLYRVFLEGVYEQGTCGLYATLDEALRAAHAVWASADGHQDVVVERLVVGEHRDVSHRLGRDDPELRACTEKYQTPIQVRD